MCQKQKKYFFKLCCVNIEYYVQLIDERNTVCFCLKLFVVTSDTQGAQQTPIGITKHELYTCKSSVNTKPPYNEHFLNGPVSVHYREVLLYIFFEFTCDSVIHFTCERTHNIHLFLIHEKNIANRNFSHHKIDIYKSFIFGELYYCISTLSIAYIKLLLFPDRNIYIHLDFFCLENFPLLM